MHNNSMMEMMKFIGNYVHTTHKWTDKITIMDIGSRKARGRDRSYKSGLTERGHLSGAWTYIGVDILDGHYVDVLAQGPYRLFSAGSVADVIISGQTIEHVENPFKWIIEIKRLLKPGGFLCIIGPSSGPKHWGRDYWRILPDGMRALFNYAGLLPVQIYLCQNRPWMDCIGIAKKRG